MSAQHTFAACPHCHGSMRASRHNEDDCATMKRQFDTIERVRALAFKAMRNLRSEGASQDQLAGCVVSVREILDALDGEPLP